MQQTSTIQSRVILYHNQSTSARLRFLRFPYDSVCAFEALPKLAMLMDANDVKQVTLEMSVHLATVIKQVQQELGLATEDLEADAEFQEIVDVVDGPIIVSLAHFTSIDPPFALAEKLDARFIDLTQARDLSQVELKLLRKAYELVMGG